MSIHSLLRHDMIPMMLVKLSRRNGKKFRGIKIKAQNVFHPVNVRRPGKSRCNESAKSTMRATQAASSSRVKRMLVAIRAFLPKEMKARSEKVIKLGSKSMHFASNLAVYAVRPAKANRATIPQSQPAYLIPIGKLSSPTPISTLRVSKSQQESSSQIESSQYALDRVEHCLGES